MNLIAVAALLNIALVASQAPPRGVRLHMFPVNEEGRLTVGFATTKPFPSPHCLVAKQSDHTQVMKFDADTVPWSDWQGYSAISHVAHFSGLVAGTSYIYGCAASPLYNFTYSGLARELTYVAYGDFGLVNDRSITALTALFREKKYDMILHAGDMAYDLDSHQGSYGDAWEAAVEEFYASVPTAILPGNHESSHNFTHYRHRMRGASFINPASGTPLWWSFDQGSIHFIGFSTELFSYSPDPTHTANMLRFLQQDLAKANANRGRVPWVVALAHKGSWMDHTNFERLGPILERGGVDFFIVGHVHNYERMQPFDPSNPNRTVEKQPANHYVNPRHMTTIVVGSPGCQERLAHSDAPYGPVKTINAYGVGMFTVSGNDLKWRWMQTSTETGESLDVAVEADSFVLTQEHHGPRM